MQVGAAGEEPGGHEEGKGRGRGDSDAWGPGGPSEAEGASQLQQQQEGAEAEYFCQVMGDEPDKDVFLKVAKLRQPTASPPPPGWKQPVKEWRTE